MPHSLRAEAYLRRQQRVPSISDPNEIIDLLRQFNYPVFEPIVRFQSEYGGLVLHSGAEPLQYGIVHLTTRTRWKPRTIDGAVSRGTWRFECCDTRCQCSFEIDEAGTYFEDGEPIASSFDVFIEGAAVYDELWSRGWRPVDGPALAELEAAKSITHLRQIAERLELSTVTEATDEHSGWWLSDSNALWKHGRQRTLLKKPKEE